MTRSRSEPVYSVILEIRDERNWRQSVQTQVFFSPAELDVMRFRSEVLTAFDNVWARFTRIEDLRAYSNREGMWVWDDARDEYRRVEFSDD